MDNGSKIHFHGLTVISEGTVLRCDKNAYIEFGDNFYCNCNCYIRSTNKISFGRDCLLGWNVMLNTSDGHKVCHNGKQVQKEAPIIIGEHVWITSHCKFCKGTSIPNNCIVAQGAVVTKAFAEENSLIGGIPAKIISQDIQWHE